ncbi:HPP family protein [Herbivorax sp. ANBcel31]|uniref:HPP family protein n=1 Tax=Herbivorax sp. ANBcel31 TaxID=3069754 RepID=UPI0027B053C1|nr:HPP family protein [Herbivorax sp. ANBcel31]MDQ2087064.1 HPP family protein [Herbivorax sp. ANBcel31]
MGFFDEKFVKNKKSYILQCTLATISMFIILMFLDIISDGIVIASLGASSFIAFTMPKSELSKPRFLIGGYFVGIISGCTCNYILKLAEMHILFPSNKLVIISIIGALGVGLAIFLMVITNTEHPPAAALSLGLTLMEFTMITITVALIGIIALCFLKTILKSQLINLL